MQSIQADPINILQKEFNVEQLIILWIEPSQSRNNHRSWMNE